MVPATFKTLRVQCTKAKWARIWLVSRALYAAFRYQIATKLTISRFYHGNTSARCRCPWRDANRPMRFLNSSVLIQPVAPVAHLDFGAHPHHRTGADPGHRVSRQRADLCLRRKRRRHRLRDRQTFSRGRRRQPRFQERDRGRCGIIGEGFQRQRRATDLVVNFEQAHALAAAKPRHHRGLDRPTAMPTISWACAKTSWRCATTSTNWSRNRNILGFDESSGLRR